MRSASYDGASELISCALQVILVTSIGTDEPFFPLNLLWCEAHSQSGTPVYPRQHPACRQMLVHGRTVS